MRAFRALVALAIGSLVPAGAIQAEPETAVAPAGTPRFPELPAGLPLWPGQPPGFTGQSSPEIASWEHWGSSWAPVVTNINFPSILPFLPPPGRSTGVAVVVLPGGGHAELALEHEGYAVGKWFAAHGIAAFVLKYRLAKAPGSTYRVEVQALMDAQRAIRSVRSRAREWGVNPAAVGIVGFSAGGEVAALAATRFDAPVPGSHDAIDALDCRPDFAGLFYPGLPASPLAIPAGTPPVFLCAATDDGFHLTPATVRLYQRLEEAGVSAEMHVYASGGHGFGIRNEPRAAYSWMGLFLTWLGEQPGPDLQLR